MWDVKCHVSHHIGPLTQHILKKAQQRLYFLRRLKKFGLSTKGLVNFYWCTMDLSRGRAPFLTLAKEIALATATSSDSPTS